VARTAMARSAEVASANTQRPAKTFKQGSEQQTLESALPNLDRIIHERMRLGIVSGLAVNESLTFNELKKLLQTTDGNLSVHARRLEEAHYVECTKSFEGRMPKTEYRLTNAGRKAFERYLEHMEALIQAMREHEG
jgi:DNA-binding HxlR family transcriptional regulator